MIRSILLFLTVLTCNLLLAQTNSKLTYELINDKISSDSFALNGFKMSLKSTVITKGEILMLRDSVHFITTVVLDNNNELYRYQSWYGDSLRNGPISLSETELLQLSKTTNEKKWRRKNIDEAVKFIHSEKKNLENGILKSQVPFFSTNNSRPFLFFT